MASEILSAALTQLWQVTLLILVVAALSRWLCAQRPHLAHLLWLVVLIKCVTPPLWTSHGGVFCWLQPERPLKSPMNDNAEWTSVALNELLVIDSRSTRYADAASAPFAGTFVDESAIENLPPDLGDGKKFSAEPVSDRICVTLATMWIGISTLVLTGVTFRWLAFWKRIRNSSRRDAPELCASLQSLSQQLKIRRRVRLIVTESLVGPAVVGFFRVTILIPAVVVDRLDRESIRPILAHELLHVRRGDLWVGLLQTVSQSLWWFHPLVWWVGRAMSHQAERCCDEEVLGELKCDPARYARALLDVLDLKSQLKPVPVFPGVRPVDVTSNRLERIMSLRQGCRRRSPWWCWLVATGAAAITLPGGSFVVTAQEAGPPKSGPDSSRSETRQSHSPSGTRSQRPSAEPPEPQVVAYALADRDDETKTVVYDTADFDHLLTGTDSERQTKFEQLVHSRRPTRKAQITWFDGKPVVNATNAVHLEIRKCLAMFIENDADSTTFDEFLASVTNPDSPTLVCDLQVITPNHEIYEKLRTELIQRAEKRRDSDLRLMPADQWDSLVNAIPSHNGYSFVAPQLAVLNGVTVMAEGVAQHGVGLKLDDDGTLEPCMSWSGWKNELLPFQREDGSYWLGMWIDQGTVIGKQSLTPADAIHFSINQPVTVHRYRTINMTTTLRDSQVAILPDLEINHQDDTPHTSFLTVRIRTLTETKGPNAVQTPQKVNGTGVLSDAGVQGSVIFARPPERAKLKLENRKRAPKIQPASGQSNESVDATGTRPPENSLLMTRRPLDSLFVSVLKRNNGVRNPRLLVRFEDGQGLPVLTGTADDVQFHETLELQTVELTHASLTSPNAPSNRFNARRLRLVTDQHLKSNSQLRMELQSANVELETDGQPMTLSADRLQLLLNSRTLAVEEVNTEQLPHSRTIKTLQKQVSVSFMDAPLDQVVKTLASSHGLNMVLDVSGLKEEGLTQRVPVSIELSGISLRSALRIILEPLNLVTSIDEDGVIIVTSPKKDGRRFLTAVYPVADLLITAPKEVSINADGKGLFTAGNPSTAVRPSNKANSSVPSQRLTASSPATSRKRDFDFEHLTKLITQTIQPDSWQEVGGTGVIRSNETTLSLVIRQSTEAHQEISNLLTQLRKLRDIQVTLQMDSLEISPSHLDRLKVDVNFEPLASSTENRYLRLPAHQAQQIRNACVIRRSPKVTLSNGQICHCFFTNHDGKRTELHLQAVASSDRQSVHLAMKPDTSADGEPLPTVPSGDAILLEVTHSTDAEEADVPGVGSSDAADPRSPQPDTANRHFVLIQADVIVLEEEKVFNRIESPKTLPANH